MTTLQSPTPPKPKQDTILLSNQTALMEREEEALVLEKSLRTGTMAICPDEASLKLLWKLEAGNELDFGGDLSDAFSDSESTMEDEFLDSPVTITLTFIHDFPLPTGTMFNRENEPSLLISTMVLQNLRQRSDKWLNHSQCTTNSDA
ncbi:hypothetical protein BLNAU_22197 [Blattamonas nauphoetae]|uniref:Uncharacterized protein n=1 Tax=Blattamonas nauphoetae TaxID=2049346 RepID=A0ABQ9WU75_9EUKA|nr:hypothetical protein BLNAU_22197 [Blattamonas nauphoetae]